MSLPSVLDIAIGLIFIYLILSLLASEIQELITTVLQWRAVHLKESIEGLLSGNTSEKILEVRALANKIYESPLLKTLNCEAKGLIASLTRGIGRFIFRKIGVFGKQSSGPSYINSDVFMSSFLETLRIPTLMEQFAKFRLENFVANQKIPIAREELREIIADYENDRFTLTETLDRIALRTKELDPDIFRAVFGDQDSGEISDIKKQVLLKKLNPSPSEIMRLIKICQDPVITTKYREVIAQLEGKGKPTYEEIKQEILSLPGLPNQVKQPLLFYAALLTNEEIRNTLESLPILPQQLRDNLYDLARRSQSKVINVEQQFNQLQKDTEDWFNRSMERSSGVYKRNAKLVAIAIGCTIAVATNADSIHIVGRLSTDQALRTAVNRYAEDAATKIGTPGLTNLQKQEAIQSITNDLPLGVPIGWSQSNVLHFQGKNTERPTMWLGLEIPPIVTNFLGWFVSGIAISMGASFWYDLLGKFIDIKNIGKTSPPVSQDLPKR